VSTTRIRWPSRRSNRIYDAQGMYENLAVALRQRLSITDDGDELVALQLRLGRVYAEALDDVPQAHRELPRRPRAPVPFGVRARGARAPLLPQRALGSSSTASTRSSSTRRATSRPWPIATRAWRGSPRTPSASARRPSSCGAACSTSARTIRPPSGAWPICTSSPPSGKGAHRGPREAGRGDLRSRRQDPDLQAPRPHLGREAQPRAELARELAEGPRARPAGRRRASAPSPRTTAARAPGRSCRRRFVA